MSTFSLFQQLLIPQPEKVNESQPASIKYQQYDIEVQGKTKTINIPLKEAVAFELALTEISVPLTDELLKNMMRKFRGIRG